MGPEVLKAYTPEQQWQAWDGSRTETIEVSFPLTYEKNLPVKTWHKRNARALRRLSPELFADPYRSYWATVESSISEHLPPAAWPEEDAVPLIPKDYRPTYGMIFDQASGLEGACKYPLDDRFSTHWCQHHPDFGGPKNLLFHHPALKSHVLLGMASPYS
jgi:hypothetical protein